MAMGSTSPRGWKVWRSPAGSVSRARSTTTSRINCSELRVSRRTGSEEHCQAGAGLPGSDGRSRSQPAEVGKSKAAAKGKEQKAENRIVGRALPAEMGDDCAGLLLIAGNNRHRPVFFCPPLSPQSSALVTQEARLSRFRYLTNPPSPSCRSSI